MKRKQEVFATNKKREQLKAVRDEHKNESGSVEAEQGKQIMSEMRTVGIPSPRVEGEHKVSGGAKYAVDVSLADMLWAIVTSPAFHYVN